MQILKKKPSLLPSFLLPGKKDASTEKEGERHNFRINEIEMVTNDTFDVELMH
jgi:hypothetical protein